MGGMKQVIENKLDENKYELYEASKRSLEKLKAGFSCNPEIDSAEMAVEYLHEIYKSCEKDLGSVIAKIEGKWLS